MRALLNGIVKNGKAPSFAQLLEQALSLDSELGADGARGP
jgi:hypothetical protein